MADETTTAPPAAPPSPKETAPVTADIAKATEAATEGDAPATEAAAPPADKEEASEKPAEASTDADAAPEKAAEPADTEMKDAEPAPVQTDGVEDAHSEGEEPAAGSAADDVAGSAADDVAGSAADDVAAASKSKDKSRRKSTGTGGGKKNLKKKGSMARILHLDAKPGDFYMIKTKGYSAWPGVIADEEMLPQAIIAKRPVTAMRPDGTYREDVADGGKRVQDRTFPVMYLETNEFAWIRNTDLQDVDFDTVAEKIPSKANKQLQAAHKIIAQKHPLSYFKEILANHQEATLAEQQALKELEEAERAEKAAKEAAKAQATPAKKSHKKKAKADDDDTEMPDAEDDEGSETAKKSSKKRKAEESAETPQRTDSVKKTKIKITTSSTPKVTNGAASTPKSSKAKDESKSAKSKAKKPVAEEAMEAPKEPELTPEERHARKEKEVLFLRHKLQRGLLTKDQGPKEEEMKPMSDYLAKLEAFPDLEVSIIRATKINKVLKAILKLDSIPKESEFNFKSRSQELLDQWTKLLAVDEKPAGEGANGVNDSSAEPSKNTPEPSKAKTNGVKPTSEKTPEAAKESEKKGSEEAADKTEEKGEDKPADEEASEPVAASA
ncbi:PWWP domain-containing protein [Coniochaeta sp. 2T2.1]|nr:PWWP domain-containing protein [Coniochaeta sp. 2T2.1]